MFRPIFFSLLITLSTFSYSDDSRLKFNFYSEPLGQPVKPVYSMPKTDEQAPYKKRDIISKVKLQLFLLGFWSNDINNDVNLRFKTALNSFCAANELKKNECSLDSKKVLDMLGVQRFVK